MNRRAKPDTKLSQRIPNFHDLMGGWSPFTLFCYEDNYDYD